MALGDILSQIDVNTMILLTFFVITFAMIMFILRRTPIGKNNTIATVISLAAALLAMYGLNNLNIDLQFQFYQLGLTDEILYIATPILTLLFVAFLSRKKDSTTGKKKFSFSRFLLILGAICFGLGFMPFIYQKAFMIGVGAGIMALGEFLRIKKKKGHLGNTNGIKFPWPGLFILLGIALAALAFLEIVYRPGIFFVAGGIAFLIGLKLFSNRKKSNKLSNMSKKELRRYNEKQARKNARWNKAGRTMGKGIAATGYGVGKAGRYIGKGISNTANSIKQQRREAKTLRKIQEANQRKMQKEETKRRKQQIEEQRKYEEGVRKQQMEEQRKIAGKMKGFYQNPQKSQLALPPTKKQLALPPHQQKQFIKNENRRQKTMQNLQSLYNQKYQEAIKQANFTAKGVPGAREKYTRLQKEIQRIVNKLNKLSKG